MCPVTNESVINNHLPLSFILADLGLESQSVILVGDKHEDDVLGANKSDIKAVRFSHRTSEERSGELHQAIHELRDIHRRLQVGNLDVSRYYRIALPLKRKTNLGCGVLAWSPTE